MKEILQNVYSSKEIYRKNQLEFFDKFIKRYNRIMNVTYESMIDQLEIEMKYLLASAVRFKSARIEIYAESRYGGEDSVAYVEQFPRIHYKYSGDDDVKFFGKSQHLSKNDNLMVPVQGNSSKELLRLSQLRKISDKQIDQVRLDIFFKYLREIMIFKNSIYLSFRQGSYYGSQKFEDMEKNLGMDCFFINDFFVSVENKGLNLAMLNSTGLCDFKDIDCILDFAGGSYNSRQHKPDYSQSLQELLERFINNYDDIIAILDSIENKKRQLLLSTEAFLDGIRQYTIPFKVMKKLKE